MSITNTPKPAAGTMANTARVVDYETWATVDTSWSAETRTWDNMASEMINTAKPTATTFTNMFSTFPSTAARSNFDGCLGFFFTVSQTIYVYSVGRLFVSGNVQNHKINIWITTNTVTPLASATILAATTSDSNNFKYADLSTPLTLSPGVTYAIASNEYNGGDAWKDYWNMGGTTQSEVTSTHSTFAVAVDTYPAFSDPSTNVYNTCTFKYILTPYTTFMTNTPKP
jgi:hypothetical protein